jgi:hypothetical protein
MPEALRKAILAAARPDFPLPSPARPDVVRLDPTRPRAPRRGPTRSGSIRQMIDAVRHPPLWARWTLTIATFAILIVVIAVVVRAINSDTNSTGSQRSEARAESEADQEGRIVITEDQKPHGAALTAGAQAKPALERAIAADVYKRTTDGQLTGPYESVRCRASGPARAGRQQFSCTVKSAHIEYPFAAVADERAHDLAWCKVDPPPEPGAPLEVPLSPRCRP